MPLPLRLLYGFLLAALPIKVLSVFTPTMAAEGLKDAWTYWEQGWQCERGLKSGPDFAQARRYYEQASTFEIEPGSWANYRLGRLYEEGWGIPQDFKRARYYYEKALFFGGEPGALANLRLHTFYKKGYGVEENLQHSKDCYKKAWNMGCEAQAWLLLKYAVYLEANQTDREPCVFAQTVLHTYQRIAYFGKEPGAWANFRLGQWYEEGIDVQQDASRAKKYYEKASAFGGLPGAFANCKLGWLHQAGWGTEQDFHQARAGYEKALPFGREAAAWAYCGLGQLHQKGLGTAHNIPLARACYQKAIECAQHPKCDHLYADLIQLLISQEDPENLAYLLLKSLVTK